MTVKIIHEDNLLKLESPDIKMVLYPESETKFLAKDDDLIIEFVKDVNKKTIGFNMTFRGSNPEFSKKIE